MLWFSAPTRLNNDLLNDGEILGKYVETINLAFKSILGIAISCNEYATDLFPEGNEKSFWKTCPKEFGISKEKWWSGGWVADLIGYRTMRAMRWIMKWDLRTTETSEDFLVSVLPFEFKLQNESVKKSRSRVGRKFNILKKTMTKKSSGWSSKGWQTRSEGAQSSQGKWTRPHAGGKWKDISNVLSDLGQWSKIRKPRGKRVAEKVPEERARSTLPGRRNESSREMWMKTPE